MSNQQTYISFYLEGSELRVFHKAVLALGSPKCVQFRVHADGTSMIMEPCAQKTFTTFRVPKIEDSDETKSVRVFSKGFCTLLANRLNWDIHKSYRILGVIVPNQKIAVFDLTRAVIISEPQ